MNLANCLAMTPHRYLMGIANTHHLPGARHTPKADLVHQLAAHLADPTALQRIFDVLSLEEQDALHRLAAHNSRMPLHDFTRAFGPIRPYRPWRRDGPIHPWRHPISTTERLLYKGLIYLTPSDPQRRQPRHVILPAEFLERITHDDPPTEAEPAPHDEQRSPAPLLPCSPAPFDPLLDLALFLAYLQQAHVRPLHSRWLSPRHLQALGRCLSPPLTRLLARSSSEHSLTESREQARHQPCQGVRSELQAGRIPFIHYLAESLGLVIPVSDGLKPSPAALAWLSQPRSAQLQALWETWLSPTDENRERWTRYRLPGHALRDPVGFAQRLARLLAAFPAGAWLPLAELVQSPHLALGELIPWWERDQGDPAQGLLQETLEGPLSWLGVVTQLHALPSSSETEDSQRRVKLRQKYQPGDPSQARWRLTPLGAWLLGQPEASPPQDDAQPLTLAEDLVLSLPSRPQLAGLLALAEWTEMGPGPHLRLTPASVARALERGGALQDLFAALARYATPPLTPAQRTTLQAWGQGAALVTLRPCILLEAADPDQMVELWGERSIRPHLGRRLTAKLATVQTPDPEGFIQALRCRGLPVRSLLPNHGRAMDPLAPGDAFWLAVAFLVHAHLARRLGLTPVPPAAVLDRLTPCLGPAGLAAAEAAAAEAIARLDEALDGPAPLAPAMPQDALLDLLEAAIQADEPLHIRYWSAWRGEVTERRVQPQRIEWRGDRLYLIAHCHLRGAERTFRLDRILDVTRCERDPGVSPAPGPGP